MSLDYEARQSVTNQSLNPETQRDSDTGAVSPSLLRKFGVRATALLMAGGLLLGATACGDNDKTEPRADASTSAPANPGAEQAGATGTETSPENPANALFPASVEQSQLYKELTPAQQAEVNRYHDMSLDEFEQLPVEQRLAYAQFVYDVYEPGALKRLQEIEPEGKVRSAPSTLTEQSSGQDIVVADDMKRTVAFWVLAKDGKTQVINEANRLDAEKMEALRSRFVSPAEVKGNNVDTAVYDQAIEQLQTANNLVLGGDNTVGYDYILSNAMEESPVVSGPTEEPTKFIHVLYNGDTTQYVYVYKTFADIQGQQRGQWTILAHEDQSSPFWIEDSTLPNLGH